MEGGPRQLGLVEDAGMIALARHLPGAPADMIALIEAWDSVRPQLEALAGAAPDHKLTDVRSEEHTSELQSLMRTSYAVFCLNKKNTHPHYYYHNIYLINHTTK